MSGRSREKKIILFALLFISFSLVLCFTLLKGSIRRYVPWRVRKLVRFIEKGSIFDIRMGLCLPNRDIKINRDDGLTIAGSLYGVEKPKKRPGILLLHGNTPLGRKLAIYRVLAKKLAERGYIVLTIDFTGAGESDDAFSVGTKEALNRDKDVYAALRYLKIVKSLDRDRIYIIGHSGGATSAFSVGIRNPDIKKIVAIGPPRRGTERLLNPRDRDYFWERAKRTRWKIYKKEFPPWFTKELWLERHLNNDMKKHIGYFSQKQHKPLLLIDGELEDKKDKIYLQNYYDTITEPKKYVTIPKSDHYCNTIGVAGLVIYDRSVITQTVNEIDQWLTESQKERKKE